MASSTALRIADDWSRHDSYTTERQASHMEHPHDYNPQSPWRTTGADAGPSYSQFAYPHLTAAYRPPTQTTSNDYRTPETAYAQHEQMYPSQPSYAPDPRYMPVPPSPQTSSHMPQAHELRQAPVTLVYPSSPYSHDSVPGYAAEIPSSSSMLPTSATSYHNVPHSTVQDHGTGTVTYSLVDPVPPNVPIAQTGPTVDYEQMLRSYERLLVDLPSTDEWNNENARQAMSSASLNGLVSAAVTGLQTLDPNARFESVSPPPDNISELRSVSPSLSSAYQMPIIRTKRRRVIQKCLSCDSTSTPEWRKGPMGPRTLCNACGLVWAKVLRKRAAEEKAKSGLPPVPPRSRTTRNPREGPRHPKNITF